MAATTITITDIIAMITNTQCHPSASDKIPANDGPIAGANKITRQYIPIPKPRCSIGNTSIKIVMTIGIRTPAQAACKNLPIRIIGKFDPILIKILPAKNNTNDVKNSFRVENLAIRYAVTGIINALIKVNPDTSHCTVLALTFISDIIPGNNGVTVDWFNIDTRDPLISTMTIINCFFDNFNIEAELMSPSSPPTILQNLH